MPEITQTILTEIGNDLSIDTMNICIDVQAKGFLKGRNPCIFLGQCIRRIRSARWRR